MAPADDDERDDEREATAEVADGELAPEGDESVDDDAPDDHDDESIDDDSVDDQWAIEEDFDWSGMPAPPSGAKSPSVADRGPRLADPGTWGRRIVLIQTLLVLAGSAPWWGLLYLDEDWERAEVAWLCAAAFGAAVALYGYRRRLSWVAAFGFVSSALVLLLQMRGASLLFTSGLGIFTTALVGALSVSAILAAVAYREIGLVT